ncbi:hypothetical protein [Streptomyces sp. Ncost-T10-10d]|uniref:hypothetical protein n=1 Tax=Streptomyces sp. Ncost-T10-10d TaxID=1839774 RepID=UPI00081DFA47|nr:hypothetical protein [Streptomyces sp. Ncost-T10-10d]SCF82995.1 glucose-6-phosphate isomerase [Streptomyces sp. Ncost-T10-10d]
MSDPSQLTHRPQWTALEDHRAKELQHLQPRRVEPALTEGTDVPGLDPSTAALVAAYRTLRKK